MIDGKPAILLDAIYKPRELCYDAFAVLHSCSSKAPVFVAERLSRAQLENDKFGKRRDKFFADARLPCGEGAELIIYSNGGSIS